MANTKHAGMPKAKLHDLPQIKDRMTFLYVERCVINRLDGAITVQDERGTVHVPAASLSVLLLGPGTSVSHRAMELIGNSGTSVIWVGENGVRYYAHGRPLTNSTRLLTRQAELVSNVRSRIAVARNMYQMRFPHENVGSYTMQQLRGREGARIRAIYREASHESGVKWSGRSYDPDNYSEGSIVNQALSAAHACLYGVVHSGIVALGCSPGLGFVHTGHEKSFVYDIADLYKAEVTIPIAFQVAAEEPDDIGAATRHRVRDAMASGHILERIVKDVNQLLSLDRPEDKIDTNIMHLWDKDGVVDYGVAYGNEESTTVDLEDKW